MKRIFIVVLVLALAFIGTVQGAGAFGKFGHSGGILNLLTQLNLTDAQKQAVATILKSNQTQSQTLRANLKTAFQNLHTVINTPNATEAAVRAAYKLVAAAGEDMVVNRVNVMTQIKAVLTPDQLAQLAQIKQARLAKMQSKLGTGNSLLTEWINMYSK
ncbi:MAG: Spy/CpxP family protein refolding chaperone [Deltaproteobacteria bacterium]|nr:Spy/CpxP family protein refolding chaperone [Deltaproteobacteria bacterium]MBF0527375.1 Spy/CpxP family protein refolding chaperone [Deltaproteobacteria bacterium]